ncbi:MAG TPA: hypothetical protein VIY47_04565 [Ignavibacteriaceae bacterium]
MKTKIVMTASSIVFGLTGILLTFIPGEILNYLGLEKSWLLLLLIQISGALSYAFAMLNWMARTSVIGGIYNKPIALANFIHFVIGSLALIKALMVNPDLPFSIWVIASIYTVFAISFAFINFKNPSIADKKI